MCQLTGCECKDDWSCLMVVESEVGERVNVFTIDETCGHNILRAVHPLYLYDIDGLDDFPQDLEL
jgi:hypothetical protein